jgi:hypothetical protein
MQASCDGSELSEAGMERRASYIRDAYTYIYNYH